MKIQVNVKILNLLKNVTIWLMLAAELGLVAFYLLGGVSNVFAVRVNAISAVGLLFSISNIGSSAFYKALFGTVIGFAYYAIAIKMIKSLFSSFSSVKPSFKNIEFNTQTVNSVVEIFVSLGECLYYSILYIVLSRMVSTHTLPSGVVTVLVLAALVLFFTGVIIRLIKNNDLLDAIYERVVCYGIFFVATMLLLANVSTTTIATTFDVFTALISTLANSSGISSWMSLLEQFGVNNVLLIIIQIFVLTFLKDLLTTGSYRTVDCETVRKAFVFTLITAISHVVISVICANVFGFDLVSTAISSAFKFLPVVAFAGVALYSFKFPLDFVLPGGNSSEEASSEGGDAAVNAASENQGTQV